MLTNPPSHPAILYLIAAEHQRRNNRCSVSQPPPLNEAPTKQTRFSQTSYKSQPLIGSPTTISHKFPDKRSLIRPGPSHSTRLDRKIYDSLARFTPPPRPTHHRFLLRTIPADSSGARQQSRTIDGACRKAIRNK